MFFEYFDNISRMVSIVLVLWALKEKIILHCFRELKCQQSYTPGIWH